MRNFVELRLLATSPVNLLPIFYILRIRLLHLLRKRNWVYHFCEADFFLDRTLCSTTHYQTRSENAVYTLRLRLGFIMHGMAIGAGTVLMPVQIGLKGIGYLLPQRSLLILPPG